MNSFLDTFNAQLGSQGLPLVNLTGTAQVQGPPTSSDTLFTQTNIIIAAALGGVLVIGGVYYYTRPPVQEMLINTETVQDNSIDTDTLKMKIKIPPSFLGRIK